MTSWQMVGLLGWLALAAALVVLLRQRRALLRVYRERDAATATAAQRLRELEVSTERLVIARELHDVVAHNLSLINVQSGMALQQVENKSAKAAGTVAEIKTTSRNALEDVQALRHAIQSVEPAGPARPDRERPCDPDPVVRSEREKRVRRSGFGRRDRVGATGVGGGPEQAGESASAPAAAAPPPREPDPTMSDLEELLRKPRLAGLTVHARVIGTAGSLPGAIDEAATQIVTESLANVIRHAPNAEATVTVRFTTDSVDLTIDNTRPTGKPEHTGPTRGMGIIAMRERTHALGGALTAGPKPSGGFRVAARLPSRPLRIAMDPDKASRARAGADDKQRTAPSGDREPIETGPVAPE
ncbi:sensor histidine kinase [Nocardia flavorosea]|uniref:sensor histidine kinase n=1 Tax=Nocardia flavorosea TaxID=53429 RepID=UPI001893BFD8|nr:histidine kinase [Nocardia flavorosea]MBF6349795.1 sensor histidine kinase [Nocardia flavorosea]